MMNLNKVRINTGRVKAGMAAKKMNREDMVQQLGISRSSFDRILREGRCAAFMLGRIARLLDIPVWELVDK